MRTTPLSALLSGMAAGALGSSILNLFFKTTSKIAPKMPEQAFEPPEPEQKDEMPTATVARRTMEGMMRRPLPDEKKGLAGELVHYGFGSAWGGLYGLTRESMSAGRGPLAALTFGALVWLVSDNLILPAFKLGAPPHEVPARNHIYALVGHLIYGLGVMLAYDGIQRLPEGVVALSMMRRSRARRVLHKLGRRLSAPLSAPIFA